MLEMLMFIQKLINSINYSSENLSLPSLVLPSPTMSLLPTHAWGENPSEPFALPYIKTIGKFEVNSTYL